MFVRVIKACNELYWYADCIGEVFEVRDCAVYDDYELMDGTGRMCIRDCVKVEPVSSGDTVWVSKTAEGLARHIRNKDDGATRTVYHVTSAGSIHDTHGVYWNYFQKCPSVQNKVENTEIQPNTVTCRCAIAPNTSNTQEKITTICDNLATFLKEKNTKYGNSALQPLGIFAKGDADNSIRVRLDDKLSRIKNSTELRKNDVLDMMGYLVLLCVDKDWLDYKELQD